MPTGEPLLIPLDLREKRLEADLLDPLSGFHLLVQSMRQGDEDVGPVVLENLVLLFDRADRENRDLRLLGASAPDLFYVKVIAALEVMDGFTKDFCRIVVELLFDQLRVRGVLSFYILDNDIREDRFAALTQLAPLAGLHVISPSTDSIAESDVVEAITYHMKLRHHIIYVERDASVSRLNKVKALAKNSRYVAAFRNQAPSDPRIQILSMGAEHSENINKT